ncbi:LamB/YcsF family protein [Occultella glacieicola]|uniref:LamB/YcsF family protein n=1 Tax=Occultella glacieicola TaxID=2518684 RepID=A0ABY2E6Y7_9MICO|nr:5-oxoprolinase subunit PxpA [Occultella glacieicola]TDE95952.1 LamB/YcsF family protein [Occultella glacieicola]
MLDLNADLGEGVGDDEAMLAVVTSANVACGGHAGDPDSMRRVCEAAAARGVRVGAHVAYPDPENFGRTFLDLAEEDLLGHLTDQLGALADVAARAGTRVSYVKPHGALYHAAGSHPPHARAVVRLARAAGLALVGAPGGLDLDLAREAGLGAVAEGFADRAYTPLGTLVPRTEAGAVLHDAATIAARVADLIRTGTMTAVDGTAIRLDVRTLCVHGDTPGAVAIATRVRAELEGAGLAPVPFT